MLLQCRQSNLVSQHFPLSTHLPSLIVSKDSENEGSKQSASSFRANSPSTRCFFCLPKTVTLTGHPTRKANTSWIHPRCADAGGDPAAPRRHERVETWQVRASSSPKPDVTASYQVTRTKGGPVRLIKRATGISAGSSARKFAKDTPKATMFVFRQVP